MRTRSIKPGFFSNEYLASLNPLARILFEGLWCIADREGRLEDRPRRIKRDVLPYDDVDVDELLNDLHTAGFIRRYEYSDGMSYIQVLNFVKHQHVHVKEPKSEIPAPDGFKARPMPSLDWEDSGSEPVPEPESSTELEPVLPGAKTSGTRNRLTSSRNPEPGTGRARARARPRETLIDDEFILAMHAEFDPQLGGARTVDTVIEDALARKKLGTYTDHRVYLKNWLKREVGFAEERTHRTNGYHRPSTNGALVVEHEFEAIPRDCLGARQGTLHDCDCGRRHPTDDEACNLLRQYAPGEPE